ncbi:acyltransferase [Stutzerimonas tarimensis]|uniref:Acyltransferase n=1 Tax=Stutzerimonas tarimensis TaxID=1507735 RepID=A0ABV7T5Q2_9GAMM
MRRLATGLAVLLLLSLNTLILVCPLLVLGLLKLLPWPPLRRRCSEAVTHVAETWAAIGQRIFAWLTPTRWEIRGSVELRSDRGYLLVCNHQSWVDIPALIEAFNRQIPFFRFFLKQELVWVPFLGPAFWALDYPFMKRHSKRVLERNPHLRGADLAAARRACQKFRDHPVTVVNYLEGTRFTPAKHQQQASPYRHLLKPKAGGVAYVLATLGDQLDAILDVTLVYPEGRIPGFWALLSGQVSHVVIDVRQRKLDPSLWQGDYGNDPAFRARMQEWVSQLWHEKDERIAAILAEQRKTSP